MGYGKHGEEVVGRQTVGEGLPIAAADWLTAWRAIPFADWVNAS